MGAALGKAKRKNKKQKEAEKWSRRMGATAMDGLRFKFEPVSVM